MIRSKIVRLAAGLVMLGALATTVARAAAPFQVFIGDTGQPNTTLDDTISAKSLFWPSSAQPVHWVLFQAGSTVIPPGANPKGITSTDVVGAITRSIARWNASPYSSFRFATGVPFSTSPSVPSPKPFDVRFDGVNLISFFNNLAVVVPPAMPGDFDEPAQTIYYFMAKDLDVPTAMKVNQDFLDATVIYTNGNPGVDFNGDGIADITLQKRFYHAGEMLESDIAFNPDPDGDLPTADVFPFLNYYLWPSKRSDIPAVDLPKVPGSNDIEALMMKALGESMGLSESLIADSTMSPWYSPFENFPTDPYAKRVLKYDDNLAAGHLYPAGFGSGKGQIRGSIFDGAAFDDDSTNDPIDKFVVTAPVFLGVPAAQGAPGLGVPVTTGLHPDVIQSETGPVRMIAQVYSGRSLKYPILPGVGGAGNLEPIDAVTALMLINPVSKTIDSEYRFEGLPPGLNYVIFTAPTYPAALVEDPDFGDVILGTAPPPLGYPVLLLGSLEENALIPEFYGGTLDSSTPDSSIDISSDPVAGDDPLLPNRIVLTAGEIRQNVDIYTNDGNGTFNPNPTPSPTPTPTATPTRTATPTPTPTPITTGSPTATPTPTTTGTPTVTPTPTPTPGPSGPLGLNPVPNGFPPTTSGGVAGDVGDINGDGFLDVVIANFSGSSDTGGSPFKRIYLNVPNESYNPQDPTSSSRRLEDVTFGDDGVPGTPDDRLPPNRDICRDIKLGDFNGDGRLDIIASNAANNNGFVGGGGFERLYLNMPNGDNDFVFVDVSEFVLPGVLNRGWTLNGTPGGNAGRIMNNDGGPAKADSTGIAVGDIDGDGDLDIIISIYGGMTDGTVTSGTLAVVDSDPSANNNPGDNIYSRANEPISSSPLVFCERVLINYNLNRQDLPPWVPPAYRAAVKGLFGQNLNNNGLGFIFIDETLGADFKFGDSTHLFVPAMDVSGVESGGPIRNLPTPTPIPAIEFTGVLKFRQNTDRVPPWFPITNQFDNNGVANNFRNSPMSPFAFKPRLGPFFRDGSIGLVSYRSFDSTPSTTVPRSDSQCALFENLDINGDGVPDGYFYCINYGSDMLFRNGSAFFPLRKNAMGQPNLEEQPLLMGLPDGFPGDTGGNPAETNLFTDLDRGAFTGVIADWENRGAPKPLMAYDGSYGPMGVFVPGGLSAMGGPLTHEDLGAARLQDGNGVVGGLGINFNRVENGATLNLTVIPGLSAMTNRNIPEPTIVRGEPHGAAAGDFDRNGTIDFVIAESFLFGFDQFGRNVVQDSPSVNHLFLNDGFGGFTDGTTFLRNNTPGLTFDVLVADLDNDADLDLVFVRSQSSNVLAVNSLYSQPPDVTRSDDPPMFSDQTVRYIPPALGNSFIFPFGSRSGSGITTGLATADLNGDGRPDMIVAEGGLFSLGDFPLVFTNNGPVGVDALQTRVDGIQIFKPLNAPFPPPRIPFGSGSNFGPNGFLSDDFRGPGNYYGVVVGDLDLNGTPDILFTRNGDGPALYLNFSGGRLFNNTSLITNSGFLSDACPSSAQDFAAKRQGRRLKLVDLDNDGDLDVVIANGLDGSGAPNVILKNQLIQAGGQIGSFFLQDTTEQDLPTVQPQPQCADGTFVASGIPDNTFDVAVADFDGDGFPDIVFANESNAISPGFRYLRNGNGTVGTPGVFTEIPDPGIPGVFPRFLGRKPRGLITGDFNGDGLPDVYVCMPDGQGDALLINNPGGAFAPGVLVDMSTQILADTATLELRSNGGRAADINNDGFLDILLAKATSSSNIRPVQFLLNDGHGNFTDVSYEFPVPQSVLWFNSGSDPGGNAVDLEVLDVDGDGDLDVWVGCAGRNFNQQFIGAFDIFYENRLIGNNFHKAQPPGSGAKLTIVLTALPAWGLPGTTLNTEVTGLNFPPNGVVSFGAGVSVNSVEHVSSDRMNINVTIDVGAERGPRSIRVTNPTTGIGISSVSGVFAVGNPPGNEVAESRWSRYR